MKNLTITMLAVILLSGCAAVKNVDNPAVGDEFNVGMWANRYEDGSRGSANYYLFVTKNSDGTVYISNPKEGGNYRGGIVVSNGKIVKLLTAQQVNEIVTSEKNLAEQKKKNDERLAATEKERLQRESDIKIFGTSGVKMGPVSYNLLMKSEKYGMQAIVADVKNNYNYPIKDIKISCKYFAASGTEIKNSISNKTYTIFQKWDANEKRKVYFDIVMVDQTNKINCEIAEFTK